MSKQMRSARLPQVFVHAGLLVNLTALGVCLLLAGCGNSAQATTGNATSPTPVATVPYVAPTIIPGQTSPTPTNTPTKATPTPGAVPTNPSAPPTAVPTATKIPGPQPDGGVPNINGQLILVSLSQQWMWVYQDRQQLFNTAITSGRPELPTPNGIYHVQQIYANIMFISGWPPGSPYYYSPEHVNHALYFLYNGYYLHDASWRHYFGPGTNYQHTNPDGTVETGSHGCVEMTTSASAWLADHMNIGATIDITGFAPVPPATPVPTNVPPTTTAVPPTATSVPPTATPSP